MIDLKHRVVYIHIPKTGGTSIESYFQEVLNIPDEALPALGVFINGKGSPLERQNGHNTLGMYERYYFNGPIPEDFRVFAVVRNPIKRFWSEYNWRRLPPPRRFPIHSTLPANLLIRLSEKPIPILKDLNSHMRPQHTYLEGESLSRVRILRQETLSDDFAAMCRDWGLPNTPLPRSNTSPKQRPVKNREKIENWVRTFYAEDFKRFGYE
ncbi:MAG: sulfotransferase family 2 domain-containing protein [Pseudomonadota bacterium]